MFCDSFDRLDAIVKFRFVRIYGEMSNVYVSRIFHWYYVKRFRKRGIIRLPYLFMLRSYSRIVKNLVVLKRIMSK